MEKLIDTADTDTLMLLLLFWKGYQRGVVYEDQLSARLFGTCPPAKRIRAAVERLLDAGLLERTGGPDREGQPQVRLTPKGRDLWDRL